MKALIFAVVIVFVLGCLIALPTISINVDAVTASGAFEYIRAALYFFPVNTVITIMYLIISIWSFRVVVALVKTIWDLLPVV